MTKKFTKIHGATGLHIEYLDIIPENIDKKVHQGHIFDEATHGIVCNYKKFSLAIKNDGAEIVGILTAYTAFLEIYVDDLWINPIYRKAGLGRKLLESLESRFNDKGYNNINLVTSQFQAPDFYKKCGFQLEFVRENKCNPKLTKFFFIKYFDNKNQCQGILNEVKENCR